jgi:hypothetical protein
VALDEKYEMGTVVTKTKFLGGVFVEIKSSGGVYRVKVWEVEKHYPVII